MSSPEPREEILSAAAQLFATYGYDAVSMRQVAGAVGMSQANLYHHFQGKEELIRKSLEHAFAQKASAIVFALEGVQGRNERLDAVVDCLLGLLADDRVFFRLFVRELVDGDGARLKTLANSVLERPFLIISELGGRQKGQESQFLTAVSIIGIIIGHVQLANLLPDMPGWKDSYTQLPIISNHIKSVLRCYLNSCEIA